MTTEDKGQELSEHEREENKIKYVVRSKDIKVYSTYNKEEAQEVFDGVCYLLKWHTGFFGHETLFLEKVLNDGAVEVIKTK